MKSGDETFTLRIHSQTTLRPIALVLRPGKCQSVGNVRPYTRALHARGKYSSNTSNYTLFWTQGIAIELCM